MKELPVKKGDLLAEKYLVESVLGVGGMGVVVEAVHLELHESRAIKVMLPEALEEKESVERFMREARAASRLKSEYVARVHDVGKLENGLPFMVMEYLQGTDLRRLLKERGRFPAPEAIHYALQVCEALAEAHGSGIVHRDLKPGNLFLTARADGTPCIKVLDFGISKVLGSGDLDEMTKTQAVLGSPSYMSPEQMRSARTVDARADIWSLGVILYRLITGELPFHAENITELVTKVLQSAPARPSSIAPDVPRELDAVLLRCLERDLSRRFANVGELSSALLPFAPLEARASVERIARVLAVASHGRDALPSAHRVPPPLPSLRGSSGDAWVNTAFGSGTISVRRWKLWAIAAVAGALALGGGVSLAVSLRLGAGSAAPQASTTPAAATPARDKQVENRPPAEPAAASPAPAAPPPATPSVTAPEAAPAPTATSTAAASPTELAPSASPWPSASAPVAKGSPLRAASYAPAVRPAAARSATPDPPPKPAPEPPVASTAPHRMFGSDN